MRKILFIGTERAFKMAVNDVLRSNIEYKLITHSHQLRGLHTEFNGIVGYVIDYSYKAPFNSPEYEDMITGLKHVFRGAI